MENTKNNEIIVSVLTPAFNEEQYICETIESILNQTYKNFEYIICDDCSTDRTWEIIQRYASIDDRIIAIRNDRNLGIAGIKNRLISMSRGRYVVW
ncbi:MAG: glycosyltransferase family 2 protein [Patescibacteria group bacterium]